MQFPVSSANDGYALLIVIGWPFQRTKHRNIPKLAEFYSRAELINALVSLIIVVSIKGAHLLSQHQTQLSIQNILGTIN